MFIGVANSPATGRNTSLQLVTLRVATDYLEVLLTQDSGAAATTCGEAGNANHVTIHRVGP